MEAQLEKDHAAGFLGMSAWIGTERSSSNEFATISYWRSIEDIHEFALSPIHRDTWNWWNDGVASGFFKNLGIMHEIFEVPRQNGFEGVYVNYHPTGMTATMKAVEGKNGLVEWVKPIVDARFGVFRSSRGRMARGDETGSSTEKVAMDPYAV
jgi:heme-degrading monooxygenase HmoA